MTRDQKERLKRLIAVRFDEPMSAQTTIGVGGPAEAFVEVATREELKTVMRFVNEEGLPFFFLGGGSNLIVRDGGLLGVTIRLVGDFQSLEVSYETGNHVFVAAGAAVSTLKFVRWATEQKFSGHEVIGGVPGTIGGNVIMNAGTHLGAIADIVEEVTLLDRELREVTLKGKSLRFEYRHLKLPRTAAIVQVLLRLKRVGGGETSGKMKAMMNRRRETQPLTLPSCGCIFKNPDKRSASQLIDEAGLKGVRVGQARISPLHANFIVNEGKATSRDVLVLIGLVRDRVKEQTGILLETEVVVVGEEKKA